MTSGSNWNPALGATLRGVAKNVLALFFRITVGLTKNKFLVLQRQDGERNEKV